MSSVDIAHEWAADDDAVATPQTETQRPSASRSVSSRRVRGIAGAAAACLLAGAVAYNVGALFNGHAENPTTATRVQQIQLSNHIVQRSHAYQPKPAIHSMGDNDADGRRFGDNDSDGDA